MNAKKEAPPDITDNQLKSLTEDAGRLMERAKLAGFTLFITTPTLYEESIGIPPKLIIGPFDSESLPKAEDTTDGPDETDYGPGQ